LTLNAADATERGMVSRAAAALDALIIRDAREEDAAEVAAIYAHHVLHGTASYDTQPASAETFKDKIRWVLASGWPFLVAEADGQIVGYAYATQFRDRAAYRWTAENSIYVRADNLGQGVGKALLRELLDRSQACGFRQMIAVIGGASETSVGLHASCGFKEAGRIHAAGWKHGRWLDNLYMQKTLGEGSSTSPE
jgi:phosphinothricin acetyltransferase